MHYKCIVFHAVVIVYHRSYRALNKLCSNPRSLSVHAQLLKNVISPLDEHINRACGGRYNILYEGQY